MPTTTHQWLLLWAARRMTRDGFVLGGFEGPAPHGGVWNALPPPFELHGYRPDAWGLSESGEIGFAEAKTFDDIDTEHTRAQLSVFGFCRMRGSRALCRI